MSNEKLTGSGPQARDPVQRRVRGYFYRSRCGGLGGGGGGRHGDGSSRIGVGPVPGLGGVGG